MINTKITFKELSFELWAHCLRARSPIGIFTIEEMCGIYIVKLNDLRITKEGDDLNIIDAQLLANNHLRNKISNWILDVDAESNIECKSCSDRSWSNTQWGQ